VNECNSYLAVTKVTAETQRYVSGLVGLVKAKAVEISTHIVYYICSTNAQYILTLTVC